MKRIAAIGLVLCLSACAVRPPETGRQALADVRRWYADTSDRCPGGADRPAALCSGVLLRATENNPAFLPWNPSPASITRGAVSFSYLRADVNYTNLVFTYRNGYILYPSDKRPKGSLDVAVLCAFPMDADTYNRPTEQGCGENTVDRSPSATRACDAQGIESLAQWKLLFAAMENTYSGQCGWNVREGQPGAAARFLLSLRAHEAMPDAQRALANELRLATWPKDSGTRLPIRAFFYVPAADGALAKAQDDQRRYRAAYGVSMPILRLNLPVVVGARATFDYEAADQSPVPP
ncbi:MAG: hypothetical protein GAK28_02513 [Luteibacter sp.]|uniref:hypothetical protein n=1 Tax=Luteibacter sp. TaxID=1886636 RepID=UPI001383BBD2|nr:hypothetical protein [Luteibacter sp.]KAF1006495.1 MAG: hypothetical protein GAK28_02513 [Luteibacter sp.]